MSVGSTIKRLRREKDITQEQLAEYLGITSRAISQWECDRTAPDISQLPALCHVFDVSSDVLLGIDVEKNNEEIKKYINENLYDTEKNTYVRNIEDKKMDISILGAVTPFNVFKPKEKKVRNTIEKIERNLALDLKIEHIQADIKDLNKIII